MSDPKKDISDRLEKRTTKSDPKKDISEGGYPSIEVGGRIMYVDNYGDLHSTPAAAIAAGMRDEKAVSRGAAGGCPQDPDKAPGGDQK